MAQKDPLYVCISPLLYTDFNETMVAMKHRNQGKVVGSKYYDDDLNDDDLYKNSAKAIPVMISYTIQFSQTLEHCPTWDQSQRPKPTSLAHRCALRWNRNTFGQS